MNKEYKCEFCYKKFQEQNMIIYDNHQFCSDDCMKDYTSYM